MLDEGRLGTRVMKARTSEEEWKWQRGRHFTPESQERNGTSGKFRSQRLFSEASVNGTEECVVFRKHIATDVSLKGVTVRDAACGWAVVQPDNDQYAVCGTMLAEIEVQRTIKRAELWLFTMAFSCLRGPATIHTDNMAIFVGPWRGEDGCIGPKQNDAHLWMKCWE